jgi:hypothetical protein
MPVSCEEIGTKVGIEDIPVILAYDRGNKRMNFERVSNTTRRKICQLTAIDYFAVSAIMSYRPNVKVLSLHVSMGFQTTNIKRALD